MKSGSSTATTMRRRTPRAMPVYRGGSSSHGARVAPPPRGGCHTVSPPRLELRHVSPVRAEREAADLGPAGAAPLEGLGDVAGLLPGSPDEDGGAGARDRRAEGAH